MVPFGGTHRIETDAEGSPVRAARSYTKSCIAFPRERVPEGAEPAGTFLTHLLDPIPAEAHVLLDYATGRPALLSTVSNHRVWKIERGRITLADKSAGDAPANQFGPSAAPPACGVAASQQCVPAAGSPHRQRQPALSR